VLHPIRETLRPEEAKGQRSMQADPQQAIESREMVEVSVRHENMAHAQQFARG